MTASDAPVALVTPADGDFDLKRVEGTISRKDILDRLANDMELFGD